VIIASTSQKIKIFSYLGTAKLRNERLQKITCANIGLENNNRVIKTDIQDNQVVLGAIFCLAELETVAMLTEHDGACLLPIAGLICGIIGAKSEKIQGILNRRP
jgi:hypothetical protein